MIKRVLRYFTPAEWCLWLAGLTAVTAGFAAGEEKNLLAFFSSLAGVTCIVFNAKGNFIGQAVSIVFGVLYGIYAFTQRYYGETLIYFFLMVPIHVVSVVGWLKNKFNGKTHEVTVNTLKRKEFFAVGFAAIAVTAAFYFLLRALNTDNLIVSTVSLTTSLAAAYFMLRRCEIFSVCFLCNDVVLIVLWSMKLASEGTRVLPSVVAFVMFLFIDAYCFFSWRRIKKRQAAQRGRQDKECGVKETAAS